MEPRICHVNLARGYRGGERQTELLIREFSHHNVVQRAVVRRGDELARRLSDVPMLDLQPITRPFPLRVALAGGCLVHAHEAKAAHFAHVAHLLTRAPYVVTRRVDNEPGRGCFTRSMYRRAAAVVAISSAVSAVLTRYDESLRPRIIPSVQARLPSTPEHAAEIRQRWPGKFLIGHVGALDNAQKGQLHLIGAARRLARSHPMLHFVLLGDGKDEGWLKREAADLPNLSFEGYVSNVGDYLAALDLFAFPSLHEGLGSVLLDAMGFGLPIVASAVDGIPEIVRDGANGILVPPANDEALASAIADLYAEPERRRRMGEAGRQLASEHTPEVMANAYLELYREILSSHAKRTSRYA